MGWGGWRKVIFASNPAAVEVEVGLSWAFDNTTIMHFYTVDFMSAFTFLSAGPPDLGFAVVGTDRGWCSTFSCFSQLQSVFCNWSIVNRIQGLIEYTTENRNE